jgi:hypothetical protein
LSHKASVDLWTPRFCVKQKMIFRSIILFLLGTLLFSCGRSHQYDKQISLLDSTKIVLQVKLNELKKVESNISNLSFGKFETYSNFLNSNLKDTINRSQANALQQFVNSGKIIKQFNESKQELIRQTETSITQIQKLSGDIKENQVAQNVMDTYFHNEKNQAEKLIAVIEQNIRALNLSLVNFKNSTVRTEELIRQINNGQLPSLVKDSISE